MAPHEESTPRLKPAERGISRKDMGSEDEEPCLVSPASDCRLQGSCHTSSRRDYREAGVLRKNGRTLDPVFRFEEIHVALFDRARFSLEVVNPTGKRWKAHQDRLGPAAGLQTK